MKGDATMAKNKIYAILCEGCRIKQADGTRHFDWEICADNNRRFGMAVGLLTGVLCTGAVALIAQRKHDQKEERL